MSTLCILQALDPKTKSPKQPTQNQPNFLPSGIVFSIFFVLNLLIWGQKSSGAVPFGTLFALLCMWLGISTPLVLVGSYFGFRKQPIEHPVSAQESPLCASRGLRACLCLAVSPAGVWLFCGFCWRVLCSDGASPVQCATKKISPPSSKP